MANPILHTATVRRFQAAINRLHISFHFAAIVALLYYRTTHFFSEKDAPTLAWSLVTLAELILTFTWIINQPFRWRPVVRSVFPERIPADVELPGVDVFVCYADPEKEPVIDVVNTVVSALALDYPAEKLAVYLSDDGGSAVTLYAMREASSFCKLWLPFCNRYGIKTRCPEAYFSPLADSERVLWNEEFKIEEVEMKLKYQLLKQRIEKFGGEGKNSCVVADRPAFVEIINDNRVTGESHAQMPLLVYVSRERRPYHPHRFKGGALNALLRVSGILSNGPYLLVLDCDMYCNDPTSARQAMCFHLDPEMSPSLAFVQYPQIFHNISKNDIYDGQSRSTFMTKWQGMDGLRGPVLTGTGFYLKRKALFGSPDREDMCLQRARENLGSSVKLIDSLKGVNPRSKNESSDIILQEAKTLASCAYEANTEWGKEIGFSYECLLESTFTGYLLHCKGWISVYLYPKRPCFLGCAAIGMKDALVQLMKWISSLLQVGMSRFSPIVYALPRMSVLQTMCYGSFTYVAFPCLGCLIYGIVPQLCLLRGIPLFPKISSPWFAVFSVVYISSLCHHLYDVLTTGGTVRQWWNEQRIWIIKTLCGGLFGWLDCIMKWVGGQKAKFRLSNKAIDKGTLEKYEKGQFDYQGAKIFMVPLIILVLLNMVCFFGGVTRVIINKNYEEMFGQLYLSFILLVLSYTILEGVVTRKNKGSL